jgi:predicted dehydrogenase
MEKIKAGIIGCGGIAKHHIEGYRKANVEVTALADIEIKNAETYAENLAGVKAFAGYRELIESGLVNAVSICTPPSFHEEAAVLALENDIHVLCEKPLAHTSSSAAKIHKAAENSKKPLFMVAYRHRFLPPVQKIKELIDQNVIGDIVMFYNGFSHTDTVAETMWRTQKSIAGGGSLMDTTSHSLDLFRHLVGEIVQYSAVMHRHFANTDVEDTSILSVRSDSGAVGSLSASWVAGDIIAFIDVVGKKGRIFFDYVTHDHVKVKKYEDKEWELIPVEWRDGFTEEVAHFIESIESGKKPRVTSFDGLRAVEIIQDCYHQDRKGKAK